MQEVLKRAGPGGRVHHPILQLVEMRRGPKIWQFQGQLFPNSHLDLGLARAPVCFAWC